MYFLPVLMGILIVVWTLQEVFQDLFQPSGSGALSSWIGKRMFKAGRRFHWLLPIAGPLSIVMVLISWVLLVALGFSLIYWSEFPTAFQHSQSESADPFGKAIAVFYFSLAALTSLGSGALAPTMGWVRIVAAFECLIGICLLTASVTWMVLIYPALGRMRTLAKQGALLVKAQEETGINVVSGDAAMLVGELARSVIRVRVDFIHFPLIYYFQSDTEGASLAITLGQLLRFAEASTAQSHPERVQLAGTVLRLSLEDLANVLAVRYLPAADRSQATEVFRQAAEDHLRTRSA
jgi:hypothetical protein